MRYWPFHFGVNVSPWLTRALRRRDGWSVVLVEVVFVLIQQGLKELVVCDVVDLERRTKTKCNTLNVTWSVPSSTSQIQPSDKSNEPPKCSFRVGRIADYTLLVMSISSTTKLILQVIGELIALQLTWHQSAINLRVLEESLSCVIVGAHKVGLVRPNHHVHLQRKICVWRKRQKTLKRRSSDWWYGLRAYVEPRLWANSVEDSNASPFLRVYLQGYEHLN